MAINLPNISNVSAMQAYVNTIPTGAGMHLFINGYSPDAATTLANLYGQECNFDNYAPQALSGVTWAVGLNSINEGYAAANKLLVFTNSTGATPNTVGGWWIDNSTSVGTGGTILYACDVIGPYAMSVASSSLQIQPQIITTMAASENSDQVLGIRPANPVLTG